MIAAVFFFSLHSLSMGYEPKEEKHILILFAAQSDLPAFPLVERGIKSSLDVDTDFRVEYFIEYMDIYRNSKQTYDQQLLDLYRHKYSDKEIDLVIPFSAPALNWVSVHGDEIFPQTPVVFAGILREQHKKLNLGDNFTGVLADVDFAGLLDAALTIHPNTRHVAVVNGASKTDLSFEEKIRSELASYADRLDFIYLTRLPLGEIEEKVRNLPENTVVLIYLLTQDGDGKAFPPWEAVSIVSEAANAPVYGFLETYFGHGIVGGRLFSFEMSGVKAGEMALRILRGEKPSDIPMTGQGTIINLFDWRQFKRWGVREDRLPPGSIVRFKVPSIWDLYRWYIILGILLVLVEGGLISYLLNQRAQRRRAQADLTDRLRFEEMLSAFSARFVNLPPDRVDAQIAHELKMLAEFLEVDRATVFDLSKIDQRLRAVQSFTSSGVAPAPLQIEFDRLPWARQKIVNGEMIIFGDSNDLPAEAGAEKDYFHSQGIQSAVAVPLKAGEVTLGLLTVAMLRNRIEWPESLIRQCGLIAEVFANALVRRKHEEELVKAEVKYRTVADFTYDWEYWATVDDTMKYVSPSCERISGYTIQEFNDNPSLFKEIIVPEDRDLWDSHYHDSRQELKPREIQFRIRRRDGQIRWIEHSCQPVTDDHGRLGGFRASNRDVTARKLVEIDLRNAYTEIAGLKSQLEAESAYLQEEIRRDHNFENIIGNSAALKYVLYKVEQVAGTDSTVLILGETGTGKELMARAIHNDSPRKARPLVKVNCAALPPNLIESELFGHERGAFTGAQTRHIGRFEVADGSTIFLDEIGELPLELQTKLLQVIQDGEFSRLGSTRTIKVDVRVIVATNRDLEAEVRQGRFREDLFYRLNVFPITVPALRDRTEDIPLLALFFTQKVSKRMGKSIEQIPQSVMKTLQDYPWTGNVRELQNVLERAVITSSGPKLRLADDLTGPAHKEMPNHLRTLQDIEIDHITRVLEETGWRIEGPKGAAVILDINPSTLRSRIRKLGIKKP